MGNIYRHRKMDKEAELAYREALELWPGNVEIIVSLMPYLVERGEFDSLIEFINQAIVLDPNNFDLWRFLGIMERRKEMDGEIKSLQAKLKEQPKSRDTIQQLIRLYTFAGETNQAQPVIQRALQDFPGDTDLLQNIITFYEQTDQLAESLDAASLLAKADGSNLTSHLYLARAYFYQDKKKEFYETAARAVELGGEDVRAAFAAEPTFAPWRNQPEYQNLITPPQNTLK